MAVPLVSAIALCAVLAVAAYLLLGVSPVPKRSTYPIDLARVRPLAVEGGEPLPIRLNAVVIASGAFPQALVVAGGGLRAQPLALPSFQVVYEDGTVVVDPVHSPGRPPAALFRPPVRRR